MAKKYFWLKLPETFFRQKDVRGLRRMGAELVIIYQKIMLDSIGCEGHIKFEKYAPTLEEEIADNIGEDPEQVKTVLDFMREHQLIVEVSEDEYELPGVVSLIGSETESAVRMRMTRSKKNNVQTMSEQCAHNVQQSDTEKRREDLESENRKNEIRGEERSRSFYVTYMNQEVAE